MKLGKLARVISNDDQKIKTRFRNSEIHTKLAELVKRYSTSQVVIALLVIMNSYLAESLENLFRS